LHLQGISCKPHGRNSLCWTFYYVNDGSKMNVNASQQMCCMVCYNNQLKDKVEERFGILFQEQWYNCIEETYNGLIAKHFEEKVNNVI